MGGVMWFEGVNTFLCTRAHCVIMTSLTRVHFPTRLWHSRRVEGRGGKGKGWWWWGWGGGVGWGLTLIAYQHVVFGLPVQFIIVVNNFVISSSSPPALLVIIRVIIAVATSSPPSRIHSFNGSFFVHLFSPLYLL